jgi:TRAP-type mannitol/chloroaromatic compound transport system permease small subunit
MPKALVMYVRSMNSANAQLGKIGKYGVLVIVAILLIEAISRYGFNSPTIWSMELTEFVFGFYFFIGGGYVLLRGEHVNMDLFYSKWSPKRKAITDIFTFPLLAVYFIVFIISGVDNVVGTLKWGQTTTSLWSPPLGPIKIIVLIGGILLFLQGIAFLIRDVSILRKGRDLV